VCPISVNFTERINVGRDEVFGITKLRNEIYLLCRSFPYNIICTFDVRFPFRLLKRINIKEIRDPDDIRSSEKENVLYVSDLDRKFIWKIVRETDDKHQIIKWLTLDYYPTTFSMSGDGHVLVYNSTLSILRIYGSNAELLRSTELTRDIQNPYYAAGTSFGNFIVLHWWMDEKTAESEGNREWLIVMSEVSRDGQTVVRRFIPSNEKQKLNRPEYILLDSDDRVFVADTENNRVILLDSDLRWNRIICPTNEEKEVRRPIPSPCRLCYDEEMKQLIILGSFENGANVYTFS